MSQASKRRITLALAFTPIILGGFFPIPAMARRGFPQFMETEVSVGERFALIGEALFGGRSRNLAAAADAFGSAECGWWDKLWFGCDEVSPAGDEVDEAGAADVAVPKAAGGPSADLANRYFVTDDVIERVVVREEADPSATRALLERLGLLEAEVTRFDGRIDAINGYSPRSASRARNAASEDADASIADAVSGGSADASFGTLAVSGAATSTFGNGLDIADGCFAVDGVCLDLGSGADGAWSTTSAAYWDDTVSRWATTSNAYWESTQTRWATTSSAHWFTTKTTADLAESGNLYYTDARVAAYIAASSTVPHVGGAAYGDVLYWTGSAWSRMATSTLGIEGSKWDDATGGINYSGGNVGIGTTNPSTSLSIVNDSAYESFNTKHSNLTQGVAIGWQGIAKTGSSDNSHLYINAKGTGDLILQTIATGKVGIGTTSPSATLAVQGSGLISGDLSLANLTATGTATAGMLTVGSAVATSTFSTGGLTVGTSQFVVQQTSGKVGVGTTSPSELLSIAGNVLASGTLNANSVTTNSLTRTGQGTFFDGNNFTALGANAGFRSNGTNMTLGNAADAYVLTIRGSSGLFAASTASIGFTSATSYSGTLDTNISRISAGVIGVGTGSQGSVAGTLLAGGIGVGTSTPGAKLHILGTTEQLRLGYDATKYASFTTGSTGGLTVASGGTGQNITLSPSAGGGIVLIGGDYKEIGSSANTSLVIDFGSDLSNAVSFLGIGGRSAAIGVPTAGVRVASNYGYNFAANTDTRTSADTGIYRLGAGVVGIGTGSAGSSAGTLLASVVGVGTTTPTTLYGGVFAASGPIFIGGAPSTATSTFVGNVNVRGTLQIGTGSLYLTETKLRSSDGNLVLSSDGASSIANDLTLGGKLMATGLTSDATTMGIPGVLCLSSANEVVKLSGVATCIVSSARFKHDIATSSAGLALIRQLRPVTFAYNGDDGSLGEQFGFIAEEVELLDPRLVVHDAGGLPFSVRYENLTAILATGIQELEAQLAGFASWFGADGSLQVQGDVCVDDVCVSREQFRQILIDGGASEAADAEAPFEEGDDDGETGGTVGGGDGQVTDGQGAGGEGAPDEVGAEGEAQTLPEEESPAPDSPDEGADSVADSDSGSDGEDDGEVSAPSAE